MENRRQTYRHSFEPDESLQAKLIRPGHRVGIACEVLDLSLGGMRTRLSEQTGSLANDDTLITHLLGRETELPVRLNLFIPSQVISLTKLDNVWHCGIHFLPMADSRANETLERALSRFLLAEQRRKKERSDE